MDRPRDMQARRRARIARVVVAGVCLIAAILFLTLRDHRNAMIVDGDRLTLAPVRSGEFQDSIAVLGTIEPIQTVYLDATEGGRVEEIYLREGATLRKGDRIMRLSNDNLLLEISNNEAEVARAINDLKNMEVNLENQLHQNQVLLVEYQRDLSRLERHVRINEDLVQKNSVAREEFAQCKEDCEAKQKLLELLSRKSATDTVSFAARIAAGREMVTSMQRNLDVNRARLAKLVITAPVDGELATLAPEVGQVIAYGARLGTINILDSYKVKANVDEHYVGRVRLKQSASCEFSTKEFRAVVSKVYPEVEDGKFVVDLEFGEEKLPPDLRIGQTSHIRLQLGTPETALLIPRGSFYPSTGGQWIFVVDGKSGAVRKRTIKLGRQNPDFYEVLEGLTAGETVITSGYEGFGEFQELIVREGKTNQLMPATWKP